MFWQLLLFFLNFDFLLDESDKSVVIQHLATKKFKLGVDAALELNQLNACPKFVITCFP
jgi:hypothetical protein